MQVVASDSGRGDRGPVVAVPAVRPSTNRCTATAHDICMKTARKPLPLKYIRTDEEITREANTYKMSPAEVRHRSVRHALQLLQLHSRNVCPIHFLQFSRLFLSCYHRVTFISHEVFLCYNAKCVIVNSFYSLPGVYF